VIRAGISFHRSHSDWSSYRSDRRTTPQRSDILSISEF